MAPKVALMTVQSVSGNKRTLGFPRELKGYGWGTWTRTKNKRIRIFRVANYTIPQGAELKPGRLSTLSH